jgi:acetylornithine deacetylase/succinyl-diaminopimelate desuccinylase-like protein
MHSNLAKRVLNLAIAIQQIPAPTMAEAERAEFVLQHFAEEELTDVHLDDTGNVLARLNGSGEKRPLVVSAHLDTVFPIGTDLTISQTPARIDGPGIGDNSVAVAGLFGLIWALRENKITLPGDLWLIANVGEEGLGNLIGMRAIVERFKDQPLAYIVLEGMCYGGVYNQGIGVRRYRITTKTAGGHAWGDYGKPSAIHELAHLVTKITNISTNRETFSSLNVGVITGGTTVNTIAAQAHIELDLRSTSPIDLNKMSLQVEKLAKQVHKKGVKVEVESIGDRPIGQLSENHTLVQTALKILKELGADPKLWIGSTDANIPLSMDIPAICIGLTKGGGAHTLSEFILTEPLSDGLTYLYNLILQTFQHLS